MLDFTMSVPGAVSINPGNNMIATIGLTSSTSFTRGISLTASGLPTGLTVSFVPQANGSEWAV